ncbi:MAG: MG2 domain-containing protein [Treponema sp.]|nr:MG2 domain-containing protein [Treponema sp.]
MNKKILGIIFAASFITFGCSKNNNSPTTVQKSEEPQTQISTNIVTKKSKGVETDYRDRISFESLSFFLTPDYTKELPETAYTKEKSPDTAKKASLDSKVKSESVIPGLRELEKYFTKYKTERLSPEAYNQKNLLSSKSSKTSDKTDSFKKDGPFTIEEWGPQKTIVSENTFPSFYVIFSQPVHELSALEEPSSTSPIMTITPPLKGTFRWYGSNHLSFEAEEAANPATEYTIKINKDTKNLDGKKITGKITFKTKAEPISVKRLYGGYMEKGESAYSSTTGALPPYENRSLLILNYPITIERLKEILNVYVNNVTARYSAEPVYFHQQNYSVYMETPDCDEEKQITNQFILKIEEPVFHNQKISVRTKDINKEYSYNTLRPFEIKNVNDYTNYSSGTKTNPLTISFSQSPAEESIIPNISFDFDFTLTEDNFEINGRTLTIYNLPISFGEQHSIFFNKGLKDIYGQTIILQKNKYDFSVREAIAYINFLDYGSKMLEAQFPHKMIFEHQNLESNSYYQVSSTENPFDLTTDFDTDSNTLLPNAQEIPQGKKNTRQFTEIDFNPYLNNGYGFVKFDCLSNRYYQNYWSDEMELDTNIHTMTVQVTDLGITARLGINKAVVMVRNLSTNDVVENATVHILLGTKDNKKPLMDSLLATGTTDKNGLCVINYTKDQIEKYESYASNYWGDFLRVYVIDGDDKAVFAPSSHNTWHFDINTGDRTKVRVPTQRTFMFVDRGLYKPGETVTFRGIDRDQLLGTLKPSKGFYSISVTGGWWNAPEIIDTIRGTLSESGGFYGSFKIPDDIEPGSYELKYSRTNKGNVTTTYANCYFTVAEFERLKIQANISTPEITFFGGDKISAEVTAEYLAGGSLNGADYQASWYSQGAYFTPDTPETKAYSFGPDDYYSGRTHYSEQKGKLSTNGSAQLSCDSEKITNGKPYNYRVEATITDISNQSITTTGTIMVHPALFYAGLKTPSSLHGFAKKGTTYDFPYILVKPDGTVLETSELSSKVDVLSYTLKRDVWTLVHEQSVDNTIYSRYHKTEETEDSGSVIIAKSGIIKITPENTGWYTLEIHGKDIKGNNVLTSIGFYVTGSGMMWHGNSSSTDITLTPDQTQYNPGDTAQILLESPLPSGDYLITVEREGIFTEEIRHFDEPATVIEVPIAGNYLPVVYVSVSSYSTRTGAPVHQYGEPDLDKPKDYYGVCALFVNPYIRAFSVKIECDQPTYKPGEKATVTLTATRAGKPLENAELTLMAVDRGVLDLINYHVPNPIEYFYNINHFPLYVKGGDSRACLMDPVTYSIKNLQGGDADADSEEEKDDERKDFRPTAVFEPVLITDKNGKATCTFTMPDSLTTYRITAFGVQDDLFALQEDEVKVQNPINVQQVQPRRLRERDTAECGVLITNLHKDTQKVTVSMEVRTPVKNTAEDEAAGRTTIPGEAFIDGPAEHTVSVASGDSTVVYFDIGAVKSGTVELVYTVKSEVLNEKLVSPIKIEKTYVYETVSLSGTTGNPTGQSENTKAGEKVILPGFTKDGRGDLSITLDATRLGMLGSSVNYLFDYPYGCLEQQSSKILPLLIFCDYIDVFNLDSKITDIKKCVTSYTQEWAKSQLDDGSFPYWPGKQYSSLYVSIRMAHIFALAKEHDYSDDEIGYNINKLVEYITKNISKASNYQQAYACYILKKLGIKTLDTTILADLYSKLDNQSLATMALLSLAYNQDSLAAYKNRARIINKKIKEYIQPVERSVTILDTNRENSVWVWYESPSEQMALILQALVEANPADSMVDRLVFTLMQEQSKGYWKNTSTTARVLEAINSYIKERHLEDTDYSAKVSLGNKEIMSESFKGLSDKPKTLKLPFEDELLSEYEKDTAYPLTFEKHGAGQLYYTVEMKYALPDEMQTARDEGIKITYEIFDYDSDELVNVPSKTSELELESGKLYRAKIRVETHRDRSYVAIRAPIPSGAEILDSTFVTTGSAAEIEESSSSWGHWLSNKTIYDNEIQFFWDTFRTGSATVSFTFRAARRGVYPTPPVQAECMYEPEIFGRSDGYLVEIK